MSKWTPDQQAVIDRDNRNMSADDSIIEPMSTILEDIWAAIDSGNIGITAHAKDVDAICKGGGSFSYNASLSNGLNFYYDAGRFHNGASIINVAASYVALTDNATNYIEVDSAGTVSDNTVGFTADRMPLFTVVTAGGVITSVTQSKPLLAMIFSSTISGARSTATQRTKTVRESYGTINATTTVYIDLPQTTDGDITKLRITTSNTAAASDVNYWTIAAVNKGAAGSGSTALLAATDANTTKATGGSGFTANVPRDMSLHGTAANLETTGPHRVAITFTKTASAPDLENVSVAIDVAASD